MKSRFAASVVLSALVLASATGCTFITQQASTLPYSASDGVNIADTTGPVVVRNAMVIADETGRLGNLVAALVNPTDSAATITIEAEGIPAQRIPVPADTTVSLGKNADALLLQGLNTPPGSTIEVHFQSGDGAGAKAQVPVLDGSLPYYSDLVPSAVVPVETDAPAS